MDMEMIIKALAETIAKLKSDIAIVIGRRRVSFQSIVQVFEVNIGDAPDEGLRRLRVSKTRRPKLLRG